MGSLRMSLIFVVIFTSALAGICIGTMTLYGSESLEYATLLNALLNQFYRNISLSAEQPKTHDAFDQIIKVVNMLIYYLLMTYLLYAVFISIMHDTYRNIGIEKGDPHRQVARDLNREARGFIVWLFEWLPHR